MTADTDSHEPDMTDPGGNPKIIDLEFETLRQFREVMAPRLNYDGFFVVTKDPLPRGTPARFRFLLPDGFVLAEGSGVVAWTRYEDEGPENPAGMALLFDELEQQNREIIDELIDFHVATGGDPFDLAPRASHAGDIGTDALAGDVMEGAPPAETVAIPTLAASEPVATTDGPKGDAYLPEWLSEVAEKHDVDLSGDRAAPSGPPPDADVSAQPPTPPEAPEPSTQIEPDFEISLFPDDDGPDATPFREDAEEPAEVTLPQAAAVKPPRDLRLKLILPVVAVLVAISAAVFWFSNRSLDTEALEATAAVEEVQPSEPPQEDSEEQSSEAAPESSDMQPSEASVEPSAEAIGKPAEVAQTGPVEPQTAEATGPARRLLLVAGEHLGDETVVMIRGNGFFSNDSVQVMRLKDPERVWIRIQGIETFYRPNDIVVGSPEVDRLRVGHHPEETPQSIYVVVDLQDAAPAIRSHTIEGDTLRVVIGR